MPTIITHAIVPLSLAAAAGRARIGPGVAVLGAVLGMLPDADVIGFRFGIAYADTWGHRGATHSLVMALAFSAFAILTLPAMRSRLAAAFLFISAASHGLLDMLTDGGLGVAVAWPVDAARHFFDWRPIRVSPIGGGFFSMRGAETINSEIGWVWLPAIACAVLTRSFRKSRTAMSA